MNFNQLRIFYSVAKNRSVTLAAKELFLTQPAVSIQIHLLEEYYDVKLFNKCGRGIIITEEGKVLLSYAEKIFSFSDEMEESLRQIKSLKRGKLKIGSSMTFGSCRLPKLLKIFKLQYPDIEIQMDIGNYEQVIERVLSFQNDIGFIGTDYIDKNLVLIPYIKESLVLITPPDHELAQKKVITFKDLNGQKMITREKCCSTLKLIEKELIKNEISIETIMELGSNEAIKQAVEAGLGVSIISYNVVNQENEQGKIKILHFAKNNDVIRNYHIIYHKEKNLSDLLEKFLQVAGELPNLFKEGYLAGDLSSLHQETPLETN
jgi:DNA-binding transcriptional LysR family regulator